MSLCGIRTLLCYVCSVQSSIPQVVELLLAKGANFEHRNVSDYTPLSLAASGGYVNIIKLLLRAGADINSRYRQLQPKEPGKQTSSLFCNLTESCSHLLAFLD